MATSKEESKKLLELIKGGGYVVRLWVRPQIKNHHDDEFATRYVQIRVFKHLVKEPNVMVLDALFKSDSVYVGLCTETPTMNIRNESVLEWDMIPLVPEEILAPTEWIVCWDGKKSIRTSHLLSLFPLMALQQHLIATELPKEQPWREFQMELVELLVKINASGFREFTSHIW